MPTDAPTGFKGTPEQEEWLLTATKEIVAELEVDGAYTESVREYETNWILAILVSHLPPLYKASPELGQELLKRYRYRNAVGWSALEAQEIEALLKKAGLLP